MKVAEGRMREDDRIATSVPRAHETHQTPAAQNMGDFRSSLRDTASRADDQPSAIRKQRLSKNV
jgi:hypothetical protein